MMSRRDLLVAVAVLLLVLAGFNAAIARYGTGAVARQLLRRIDGARDVRYVATGNSLMAAGFDERAFEEAAGLPRGTALNAALGSSSPVEHLALFDRASHRLAPRAGLLYGFFDFQLSDPPIARTADFVDNRSASYYLDPDRALREYELSAHDRVEFELFRRVPMMVERGRVWAHVEVLRRELRDWGLPPRAVNRFGDLADMARLETATPLEFAEKCRRFAALGEPLSPPVSEMLRVAERSGATAVMVEMPMSSRHRERFYRLPEWPRYRGELERRLAADGAVVISAADWIDDARFSDNIHLDAAGAREFSEKLAARLGGAGLRPSASR